MKHHNSISVFVELFTHHHDEGTLINDAADIVGALERKLAAVHTLQILHQYCKRVRRFVSAMVKLIILCTFICWRMRYSIMFHEPSLPNSFVQSALLTRSILLTVGREAFMAFTKSLTCSVGSSRWSESTFVHVISNAPLSPGEQGVNLSSPSTVT